MSLSALTLTPSLAKAANPGSDLVWAKQVQNYAGLDLTVADTFIKMPFLIDFSLPEEWSDENGTTLSGVEYLKRSTRGSSLMLKFADTSKDALYGIQNAMDGNIYSFVHEVNKINVAGKWKAQGCLGQLNSVPAWDAAAEPEFGFKVQPAEADITTNLTTAISGASITIPASTSLVQPTGLFRSMVEATWPA